MRLLIVEDDALLADGLARTLRRAGHAVDCVEDAERAWLALETAHTDGARLRLHPGAPA